MVRLKHRYLLVNILYPSPSTPNSSSSDVPSFVEFNQPTTDDLTPQILTRAIRDDVGVLFGDYGVGIISNSLSGKNSSHVLLLLSCSGDPQLPTCSPFSFFHCPRQIQPLTS